MSELLKHVLKNEFERAKAYLYSAKSNLIVPFEYTEVLIEKKFKCDNKDDYVQKIEMANKTFQRTQYLLKKAINKLERLFNEIFC